MKLLFLVAIAFATFSALYYFYGNSEEYIYTDKAGLIDPSKRPILVCKEFPRLKNLYVQTREFSWQRRLITTLCEGAIGSTISNSKKYHQEVDEFDTNNLL